MMCRNPFLKNGAAFGCGQCDPCRSNKRRQWAARILMEAKGYSENCMLTLTYDDQFVPTREDGRRELVPRDLELFLKRFRERIKPRRIRFFGCGEYGTETWRPHYHLAVFNYPNCVWGQSTYNQRNRGDCCVNCDIVRDTWDRGNIFCNELNDHTAQYVAKYVTKKMTDAGHPALKGLHPEFPRMSKGLGKDFMWDYSSTLLQYPAIIDRQGDVPSTIMIGGREWPIGRYLKQNLRKMVGRDEKAPQATLDKITEELRPMREAAFDASQSFKKTLVDSTAQRVLNIETRNKIMASVKKGKI